MATADLGKNPADVAAMFTDVAKRYDVTNAVLSGGNAALWRIATVKAIDPKPGEKILDIAAGTGTSSAAIAKSGAEVIALDFSPGMLEQGRKRHPGITFVEGDAEALPFPPQTFDAVTISFGLRNVNNPQLAIGEMYRVLKPGGRVVICEFSHPDRALIRGSYKAYLKYVMPAVAKVTSSHPDAYTYLMDSINDWPDQAILAQWLRAAGFHRVAYRNLTGGIVALHRAKTPERNDVRSSVAERRKRPASPSTQTNQTVFGQPR